MKVVVDTNVFVESLSKTSPYHPIFESLLKGKFLVCVSNSIVLEYEEIVKKLHRIENANKFLSFLAFSPYRYLRITCLLLQHDIGRSR